MEFVIDRIENDVIIAELPDGTFENISGKFLPDAAEGDCVKIEVLKEKTAKRKKDMESRLHRLFGNPGTDD